MVAGSLLRGVGHEAMLAAFVEWCAHHRLIFSSAVGDLAPQQPAKLAAILTLLSSCSHHAMPPAP